MKLLIPTFTALALLPSVSSGAVLLNETFDSSAGFTTSTAFFADTFGDYLGIAGSSPDFGTGSTPGGLKGYTGFDDNFLTGMDLDGEGATLPITVGWTGIDISGETGLTFSGDFAEFFDSPGDIDQADQLFVEAQIDGGGYVTILEFTPGSFSSGTSNGFFELGADTLGDAAQTFTAPIAGTGSTLDIRLTVDLNSGDEDFGVDNFVVTSIPEPTSALLGSLGLLALLRRRR